MVGKLPMNLQLFAEGGDGEQSGADDTEQLQKQLSNAQAQSKSLKEQKDSLAAVVSSLQAAQSGSASSAAPSSASSTASGDESSLQAQIDSLTAVNNSLAAYQQVTTQRDSFAKKAAKDGISLTDDDFDMIVGSSDQNKAYKYVKGLKETAPKHPNKQFPNDTNNKPVPKPNNSVGAELYKEMHQDKAKNLAFFMPGASK